MTRNEEEQSLLDRLSLLCIHYDEVSKQHIEESILKYKQSDFQVNGK